jgi:hypothetical protein
LLNVECGFMWGKYWYQGVGPLGGELATAEFCYSNLAIPRSISWLWHDRATVFTTSESGANQRVR